MQRLGTIQVFVEISLVVEGLTREERDELCENCRSKGGAGSLQLRPK